MRKQIRLMAGIAFATAAMMAVSACSGSGSESSSDADTLTVYNAQHESLTQEWADAFTAETGIEVELRNGSDTELGNQLVAEGDQSPADVFLTENSPAMTLVENAGLFADVNQDVLDQVPSQYRPSSGAWTGIAARSTVFAYNKDQLPQDQLPKSLLDLQDPAWKDRWAASPSGADFQAIVSALLELRGEDATRQWLAGMKENVRTYKGNNTVMKAVNAGEVPGGVIYHYYWFGDQAKTGENSNNVALHYFRNQDPGAFVSVSGGGVLKSSSNQDAAQQFLKFVTGKSGQEVLQTGTSFEYTVASDVPANPELVPLADLQAPPVDPAKLNSPQVTELMTEAGLL
ncbi:MULTISPECIES: iron ABC transporter substrate-binding protein [Rhodococcus]|uniref:Iron ABC transporter substrate-binding protein n=1 Tax=Rhodococcus oxybenzonivorans TaxID=1990687 RepID=A0AAE4V4J5_9NOCA|nr:MULTISPECIES: iron ABC transporter substrate-binding protein [Rhodococcus]MDV7246070.1 iron ABC transporter substrate-binding protein [Rhodococcus oxybenzonivorans]MDV7268691.1 iron ABC transporter substrate-binding protein [Rhodococcus oxybenzonivorans]MDV7277665.1 iron ABC transporter substrate-binding protein [Rhodococcus oxybenzonivorans]MDV7337083.1 iron ABC transporter substrate-binding protein [Rhodococcus oxybenzonivorans]MDV7347323.1 iron ABC transporter substrate-binding protein [